ncbi:SGNH/GDSL hydrolase family protein [Kitasatospora cystarginea]|uniref:SGNH/GDSL hydrolase family protein n=1 Tax=Kitasatospora cystarginea TaxID=58350 RepID=A0ABP5RM53_9ACTN
MITNPNAVTVLCYGDSNTNGQRADTVEEVRWPADVRWTGQLQELLGDGYYVIEEGLGGRTTDLDYPDEAGCNGRTYLLPCLRTHYPLDVVLVMLGTNDVKPQFARSSAEIVAALGSLVDDIEACATNRRGGPTEIVLVAPVPLDRQQPKFTEFYQTSFDAASEGKSRQLAGQLAELAKARDVLFADAGTVARVGIDGVHLSLDSHRQIAELAAGKIAEALGRSNGTELASAS